MKITITKNKDDAMIVEVDGNKKDLDAIAAILKPIIEASLDKITNGLQKKSEG